MEQEVASGAPGDQRSALVRLVTRLVLAQAALAGAIGLFFSRRHLPSIVTTVVLIHPAVACAFGSGPRPAQDALGEPGLEERELGQA